MLKIILPILVGFVLVSLFTFCVVYFPEVCFLVVITAFGLGFMWLVGSLVLDLWNEYWTRL